MDPNEFARLPDMLKQVSSTDDEWVAIQLSDFAAFEQMFAEFEQLPRQPGPLIMYTVRNDLTDVSWQAPASEARLYAIGGAFDVGIYSVFKPHGTFSLACFDIH